ncbi:MAG: OmpA family protein [Acidobacteria bacterium]|nr:OmpA family protein [Acidobacteriota bacterium]
MKTILMACLLCLAPVAMAGDHDGLEHVNFPLNSSVVVDAFQGLDLLGDVMKKYPDLSLEVVGYTDDISTENYNRALAERRAKSVKAYLESRGVDGSRVTATGKGEINFVAANDSREGRFQNRRVELLLYETVDGTRKLVSYHRLIELFFDGTPKAEDDEHHQLILQKLSDLEKQQAEFKDAMAKHAEMMKPAQSTTDENGRNKWNQTTLSGSMNFQGFSGVSFDIGIDDNDDFTGRIAGQYFKAITDQFGVQAQGDYTYYDTLGEGQFDAALIYQIGRFKMAGAASYKMIDMDGFSTAIVGQGSVIADITFDNGSIGLFGTAPFDDGDVVDTSQLNFAYVRETYVDVVQQFGLSFGFNIGSKAALSGSIASLDTDHDSDIGGNLRFGLNLRDNLTWYLEFELNENLITDDDSERYATGIRLGSWGQARSMSSDQVTPVMIPRIRYELATRDTRTGNTSPIAEAGPTQTDVPAGTVTLNGSASSDPEGDALSFSWTQVSGPLTQIANSDSAIATFEGAAGAAYSFMLTVRDEFGASGSDIVSIFMEAAPEEVFDPVINFFTAAPTTITQGELVNLTWSTDHADTVMLTPYGQVNAQGSLVLSPTESIVYTLSATNDQGTVSETVTITVNPVEVEEPNTAPVAHAGADIFRNGAGTIMLNGTASFDPDGDDLTYQWIQIAGEVVSLAGDHTATPSFEGSLSRNYIFRLVVSDGKGGIDTDDVLVTVF